MKILFVAMSNSIHTVRWISQIADQGWQIFLFSSIENVGVHPELPRITIYNYAWNAKKQAYIEKRYFGSASFVSRFFYFFKNRFFPDPPRTVQLIKYIKKIKPDVVHTLEMQSAGYLYLEAMEMLSVKLVPWIHSTWGSDIFLFARLKEHKEKVKGVLSIVSYLICECQRDRVLARSLGFEGKLLSLSSATGGYDLEQCYGLRQSSKVSERKMIMLKGYQGWSGRALAGLRALERCIDVLLGYRIAIYVASPDVLVAAELFADSTGIPLMIIPAGTSHREMLRYHGKSRLSIGINISDGLPSSLLEAMVMGSFPIQSNTSCCDEWIEDGKNGFIVPPEDPEIIEKAIRWALTDDDLVNTAAEINYKLAKEKLDQRILKPKAINIYKAVTRDAPLN